MDRLDKILSRELNITRSEAKALIKSKSVFVNFAVAERSDMKCCENDTIQVNGKSIKVRTNVYIMQNKPTGVISATYSNDCPTVIDILPEDMKRAGLFPAGRLDKDTTGFVLITDDGKFAHDILSPKKHIDKTYTAVLDKPFGKELKEDFEKGMILNGEKLIEAKIDAIDGNRKKVCVVLRQGVYHQIKRMFKKHGITVLQLNRDAIGNVKLDSSLEAGESRYLTEKEILSLKQHTCKEIV